MLTQSKYLKMLRWVLRMNASFSGIFGLVFIFDAGRLAEFLGLANSIGAGASSILIGIGISLLLFSAGLFINTSRKEMNLKEVYATIALDAGWVLGSAVLLFGDFQLFSDSGWWFTAIQADVVALFALLQYYTLRKTKNEILSPLPQFKVQNSEG
jgi:hypothetical protein